MIMVNVAKLIRTYFVPHLPRSILLCVSERRDALLDSHLAAIVTLANGGNSSSSNALRLIVESGPIRPAS